MFTVSITTKINTTTSIQNESPDTSGQSSVLEHSHPHHHCCSWNTQKKSRWFNYNLTLNTNITADMTASLFAAVSPFHSFSIVALLYYCDKQIFFKNPYLLPSGWNERLLIGPKWPFMLPNSSSKTMWKNRASNLPIFVEVMVTFIASCPPPTTTWTVKNFFLIKALGHLYPI